jgi:hypothetical protein
MFFALAARTESRLRLTKIVESCDEVANDLRRTPGLVHDLHDPVEHLWRARRLAEVDPVRLVLQLRIVKGDGAWQPHPGWTRPRS